MRHTATAGAGMSKEQPWEGAGYSYPILVANAGYDGGVVHALVKAMVEGYDGYKDSAPGAAGWALDRQNFDWVIPFHDGAIMYFKEAGVWTDEMQKHNDMLVKRQDTLAKAWQSFKAANPPGDEDEFRGAWMKVRADALEGAGFDPVFK